MAACAVGRGHPSRLAEDGSHLRMTSLGGDDRLLLKKKARLSGPSN
jgi:hypothetical protein